VIFGDARAGCKFLVKLMIDISLANNLATLPQPFCLKLLQALSGHLNSRGKDPIPF
jgi:hypothetical protein